MGDAATVAVDLPCLGRKRACAYNLRTLPADGRCPECGEPVETSIVWLPDPAGTNAALKLAETGMGLGIGYIGLVGGASMWLHAAAARRMLDGAVGRLPGMAGPLELYRRASLIEAGLMAAATVMGILQALTAAHGVPSWTSVPMVMCGTCLILSEVAAMVRIRNYCRVARELSARVAIPGRVRDFSKAWPSFVFGVTAAAVGYACLIVAEAFGPSSSGGLLGPFFGPLLVNLGNIVRLAGLFIQFIGTKRLMAEVAKARGSREEILRLPPAATAAAAPPSAAALTPPPGP
jgi:hypothetical protein